MLPTPVQLQTMDYERLGTPFVRVPAKASIKTQTLDYERLGTPFATNDYGVVRNFGFIFG